MFTAKDKLEDKFFSVSMKRVLINNESYLLKKEVLVPSYMEPEDMLLAISKNEPIGYRINYVLSDPLNNDLS